jgi:hypothetical protein
MIGVSGRVPINWHPRAIGASGLSSRVADSARRDAVPSGCLSKCGRVANGSPSSVRLKPMCATLWLRARVASSPVSGKDRPLYEPSKRRLTWDNGAVATCYSGDEPDQLRGPQHDGAWLDELAKYRYAEDTWSNLDLGLRLGESPQAVVTTTPRPIKIVRELIDDRLVRTTRGSTYRTCRIWPSRLLNGLSTNTRARASGGKSYTPRYWTMCLELYGRGRILTTLAKGILLLLSGSSSLLTLP